MGIAQPQPDVQIRRWQAADGIALETLLLAFLRESHTDIAPTLRSAHALLRMGLVAAEQGDPCLIAVDRGVAIGYCCWLHMPGPFDMQRDVCLAFGTYVVPDRRREGLATRLWLEARSIAAERGYDAIVVTTFEPSTQHGLELVGFGATGTVMEVTWPRPTPA